MEEQLYHWQAQIAALCRCVKDRRLAANAGPVDGCPGIDVSTAVEQESGGFEIAVFRSYMQ